MAAVESYFMQSIKEADQLKHKGAVVSDMQAREHRQLFSSLCTSELNEFCRGLRLHWTEGDLHFVRATTNLQTALNSIGQ